jgi:hypothetical protein
MIKNKAKLIISEPWDQKANNMIGEVEEKKLAGKLNLIFTSMDNKKYILRLRFKESRFDDIWMGKHVIVNIEEYSDRILSGQPENELLLKGIGSIELIS